MKAQELHRQLRESEAVSRRAETPRRRVSRVFRLAFAAWR